MTAQLNGSLTLGTYPDDVVRLACEKCGCRGQHWKASLIARFGLEIALPDLSVEIAQGERQNSMQDPCGVHYVGPR